MTSSMLVICNGGQKGGSTWLILLIKNSGRFERVPASFCDSNWSNPSISDEKFDAFFSQKPYKDRLMYCKQHWANAPRYLELLKEKDIRILNIIRDYRDVLVSRYYHELRRANLDATATIEDFYFTGGGRRKILQYMRYQLYWHSDSTALQPHLTQYEKMLQDPQTETKKIFNYLDIQTTDSNIEGICKASAFETLPNTGEGKFFRKGVSGDWRNHLESKILDDLSSLAQQLSYWDVFPEYKMT